MSTMQQIHSTGAAFSTSQAHNAVSVDIREAQAGRRATWRACVGAWLAVGGCLALASTAQAQAPRIHLPVRQLDLGTIKEGDIKPIEFTVENRGEADLVVISAKGDCGCTVVRLSDEERVIPPGGSLTIQAEFNSTGRAQAGVQTKKIHVTSNDPALRVADFTFNVQVVSLLRRLPTGVLRIMQVERGATSPNVMEFMSGSIGLPVEIKSVAFSPEAPLSAAVAPFDERGRSGQRITLSVSDEAPLGSVETTMIVTLAVGEHEAQESVPVVGEVVGDLSYRPIVVDTTRKQSLRGQRLIPVSIKSSGGRPFEVRKAEAGPLLDVEVTADRPGGSSYDINLTVRDDAPDGPFGAMLRLHTDSLDQPLIEIPVYGQVAPAVAVEPPLVLLVDDGTPVGTRRVVKLQGARPNVALDMSGLESSDARVKVEEDPSRRKLHDHVRYLIVSLAGNVPPGRYEATIRVSTAVPSAEVVTIPVVLLNRAEE